jgi:hypothetical protein
MLTFDVFAVVARDYSSSAALWLNQLAQTSPTQVRAIFNRIPPERISPTALEFAYQMLDINRNRLLRLREELT